MGVIRKKEPGEAWETVEDTGGSGSTPTLAQVLAQGADANGVAITNLPDGVNPQDAATVAQTGGSQPVTSPLDIADCVLWLDASQLALSDDDPVAAWPDLSTSGYDFAQADADHQPVFKDAIQNGLGVVRFDGLDIAGSKFLDAATAAAILKAKPGLTFAYVTGNENASTNYASTLYVSVNGDPTKARFYLSDSYAEARPADDDTDAFAPWYASGLFPASFGGDINNQGYQATSPAWKATVARLSWEAGGIFTIKSGDGGLMAGQDASHPMSSLVANNAPAAFPNTNSDIVRLGEQDPDGFGYGYVGDLAELVVYDRALNALEARQLAEYLSAKWGTV